ncbi:dual specificity protein phosphatase family protein [Chitinibacter bivalviorum]|uniref:Dual specificity protein phosphatase family protein n=1 Tax=Chitinibacter bivalviorum TaxID=2739434 RepID=A0A7H9BIZ6_9NEIS|nr:dual specificity protein phosphatase family protein [Chitinibacter bivalviorum]QLG88627.1 dual specificity protein phosphatase family protein [Chitinibacter bivalviorum]
MNQHPFDALALPAGGTVLFTPCPGSKEADLATSVAQLQQAGASAIITLMPSHELSAEGVATLPQVCAAAGLQWFHFPIEDDSAPQAEFETAWQAAQTQVLALLAAGATIAVHCKGGSGRTGLMIALIMRAQNTPLATAVELVQNIRPKSLRIPAHMSYLAKA